MSYTKATLLAMYLQKGVKFIGTNADKFTMVDGFRVPGNGSMIQYLENVTGAKAEIVGKPNPFVLDQIISEHNLIRDKCLMIGDSL